MRSDWEVSTTSGPFLVTAGTLRLNNMAADTFAFESPATALAHGAPVQVRHAGRLVFSGAVHAAERERSRGSAVAHAYTARGPWQTLEDIIYRQKWMAADSAGALAWRGSSRVILNQHPGGSPMLLEAQVRDILAPAADAGAFTIGAVSVPAVHLPADEQRGVTLAQALMRCLRLFPSIAAWFDYSGTAPVLHVGTAAAAAWLDDPALRGTLLTEARTGSPPRGVVLEIESTGEFDGTPYRVVGEQAAGDVSDPARVLYIPLDLAGASGSTTLGALEVEAEDIPQDWKTNKQWWKSKHPRLANVDADYLTLKDAKRASETAGPPRAPLPRITSVPVKDIEAAGLRAEMDTFRAKARIPTLAPADNSEIDAEEDVEVDHTTVAPVSTTEFSPGRKSKLGAISGAAKAVIDPSVMPSGNKEAVMREVAFITKGSGGKFYESRAHFLANEQTDGDEFLSGGNLVNELRMRPPASPGGQPTVEIYAPGGVPVMTGDTPAVRYPGAMGEEAAYFPHYNYARDGDWIDTGLSPASGGGALYAYLDGGAVKYSLAKGQWDSDSDGSPPTPYARLGHIAGGRVFNCFVGVGRFTPAQSIGTLIT
ncbi:MAG: hypothetical protein FWG50_13410 [Kiritimatiellaeota bacterium]|nr:hypothetical protein [Kiritimatiellota bacterium]